MTVVGPDAVLGAPYLAETITLQPDEEGEVVATLVHRPAVSPRRGAVLHVHGFCDYFFHTEYGAWWAERGYDVYAVDLRKYGRSLRPHQTPTYVTDLRAYGEELDAAWQRITERDGHDRVVLSGHSTGGLVVAQWAHDRAPSQLCAMVLNAPWFDLRGPLLMRTVGTFVVDKVGGFVPRRVIPRTVSGLYGRSLHRDHGGEFDYDLRWKPLESVPVYAGWLRAVRRAHAELHRGLAVGVPVVVLSSDRTTSPRELDEDVYTSDIVLDVEQIRRWSPSVGARHLTLVTVPGAMHDVVLSRPPARRRAYAELGRWLGAYVEGEVVVPEDGAEHYGGADRAPAVGAPGEGDPA
ncbi:alpha/beta hydrolase [Nocardioides zeae]|uniref:Alpha/beta hydrolase n=1 Tax=Nocardioides imazamoxiresistens TaxID=3231893 RepID=A0ABU3PUE5_9ACTN|nr:alpha/beta hydrolase [Nocardioides zeae]MDT9592410.1 alpha/beta hydrolase [Nocardioides zeae]